ncbi:MAG TPA: MmcQ/YjbR family DNA-binding protein [Phenylobacterium sp.]|uniref:MmcQ/YjbR family DNA-binding protein n=1 Tax=Phenylobacterium sp. TaxID=1871053 RepID=UPI002D05D9F6|nr:MmcQ/YjbR family DNA-binding protein [Phenylobacterium sp.]HSV02172.1 MmcQ/YjbR family DNA-binding protein [Phenylobacterium sp.]
MSCAPEQLRRLALALPGAYEDTHRGKPAFRVAKRIFGMLSAPGGQGFMGLDADRTAVLKLDREDQLNMAAALPGAVQPAETYGHHGWTCVRLAAIEEAELARLVRLAWTHVAPKRLSRTLSA